MSAIVERVLERLDGVRRMGDGWTALCPCRSDDGRPTVTVGQGDDEQVLLKCHRGGSACSVEQICTSIGLKMSDLWPEKTKEEKPERSRSIDGNLTHTYHYTDANGDLVLQVLRFERPDGGKDFRQRVPDSTQSRGWRYSTADLHERPLYRLPLVLETVAAGGVVFVVEGEKDADTLYNLGYTATCNPMGADNGKGSKWKPNMTAALAGARVVVIGDNDKPGQIHAAYVAEQLTAAGCSVKRRTAPPPHKDVTDLIDSGGTIKDLVDVDVEAEQAEQLRIELVASGRLVTWRDFIDESTTDAYDWLIEGLIERGERIMVVAAEGVGKTTLARQVAILSGAGINPFTYCKMPRITTLMVDLENPEKIIRRQSRRILDAIQFDWGKNHDVHAHLWMKPDGIDILSTSGRELLEAQIERVRPDLLVLGPIYKSFLDPGTKTSTALITEVTMYFDYLRARYGCALWLEHHAPLGNSLAGRQIRPADSAVWMRWPEFGFGLSLDPTAHPREYLWDHWRGQRDSRVWPARLRRGSLYPFEVVEWSGGD